MKVEHRQNIVFTAQDRAKGAFSSVNRELTAITKKVGVYSAAIGAAGIAAGAGLAVVTNSAMKNIDALSKASDKLGITTEALGYLRHAAELTGVSQQSLDSSLERMVKRLGEADAGYGAAQKGLEQLGLSAGDLIAMGPEKAFGEISEAIGGLSNQSEKAAATAAIFGREGVALVNTLALGKSGLHEMAAEADALGISIDRIEAAKIEQANDAITRARAAFQGVGNTIAVNLAPYVTAVASGISEAAKESGGFKKEIGQAMEIGIGGVENLVFGFTGLNVVWRGLEVSFLSFQETLWSGLHSMREGTTSLLETLNVAGLLDDQLAKSKQIHGEQALILNQIRLDREAALKSGANSLALHDQLKAKLEVYRQSILAASQAAAEGVARSSPGSQVAGSGDGRSGGGGTSISARLDVPDGFAGSFNLSGLQREQEQRFSLLQGFKQSEYDLQSNHLLLMSGLNASFQAEELSMVRLTAQQKEEVWANSLSTFTNLTNALYVMGGRGSRKMFEMNKIAGIAEATISTYQGAAAALKLGWPMGPIAAAAITAQGLAQVASIKSQTFSGGSSSYSTAAGGASPVITTPDASGADTGQEQQMTIIFKGIPSGLFFEQMVDGLNDAGKRNIKIEYQD